MNIDEFTTEVIAQVLDGVQDAREKLNILILDPEYIDFSISIKGEDTHFRVLTK